MTRLPDEELTGGDLIGNFGWILAAIFSMILTTLASPLLIVAAGILNCSKWARSCGIMAGGLALIIAIFGNGSGVYSFPFSEIFSFEIGLKIGAGLGLLSFLFGIGLFVYAAWFLSGEQSRRFYDGDFV